MTLRYEWVDGGREPRMPPDPRYPQGIDIDETTHSRLDVKSGTLIADDPEHPSCFTYLHPYPARRCGAFILTCDRCGLRAIVTTAGRPDDPRSVRLTCKPN